MSVDSLKDQLPDQTEPPVVKKRSIFRRKTREEKIEIACLRALKRANRGFSFWFLILILGIAGVAAVFILEQTPSINWSFEPVSGIVLAILLTILILNRIAGNWGISRRLKGRRKYYKQLPEESNVLMRELYLVYCKRKCVHFWISLIFSCLSVLAILYILVAVGVDSAANRGAPKILTIHQNWDSPTNWAWYQKTCVAGGIGFLFSWFQYFFFRKINDSRIYALEERYGREKIIHESIYCFRMSKINFRYKTAAFVIVCLTGCLFYLLFKRLICIIFEKSCVI